MEPKGETKVANEKAATCSVETIMPEKAQEWLGNRNPNNRKLRDSLWRQYAADMAAGRWKLNGQPIIFDEHGNLLDGQHRLQGCVFSKASFQSFVHRNIEQDVFYTIDAGSKRTNADHLHRAGIPNSKVVSAAARWLHKYHEDTLENPGINPTVTQVQETALQHGREINDAFDYIKGLAVVKKLIPNAVATFIFLVFARIDRQKAIAFFDRLESGDCGDKHAALNLLRNRLLLLADKGRSSGLEKLALAFKSWIYFREDAPINRLVIHPNEHWSDLNRPIKAVRGSVEEAA
jgi:hypothetical protein